MARTYRVVLSKTQGGLQVAADDWIIVQYTARQFSELDSNDDQSFTNPQNSLRLLVKESGWLAMAYKDF